MQGVSLQAIQNRIKHGTISPRALVKIEGKKFPKIDSDIADADFAARKSEVQESARLAQTDRPPTAPAPSNVIDEMFGEVTDSGKGENQSGHNTPESAEPENIVNSHPDHNENFNRYRKAKAGTEELKARKLEMEVAEMEGRLLDVEEVRETIQKACTVIRENFLNLPAKIGPELLACTDLVELETKLYAEINQVLSHLSTKFAKAANGSAEAV